jgi:hypothetical protein
LIPSCEIESAAAQQKFTIRENVVSHPENHAQVFDFEMNFLLSYIRQLFPQTAAPPLR